jgi:hypothetical protein
MVSQHVSNAIDIKACYINGTVLLCDIWLFFNSTIFIASAVLKWHILVVIEVTYSGKLKWHIMVVYAF